jgi:hypothetical protein
VKDTLIGFAIMMASLVGAWWTGNMWFTLPAVGGAVFYGASAALWMEENLQ